MSFEQPQCPTRGGKVRPRGGTSTPDKTLCLRALHAALWISGSLLAACAASQDTTHEAESAGVTSEASSTVQATFYVAPWGSDGNPGTQSAPFLTVERARAAVAPLAASMTGDIAVVLRGGTYRLTQPLSFTSY